MDQIPLTKTCAKCRSTLPLNGFSPSPKGVYGRHAYCRACANDYAKWARTIRGDAIRRLDNERRSKNPDARKAVERRANTKRRADPTFNAVQRLAASDRLRAAHNARALVVGCRICGAQYCPLFGKGSGVRTCSPACSHQLRLLGKVRKEKVRKHRKRGITVVDIVDPIKVFDRDGWRCQICKSKTPRRLRGSTHPRAPELDHIMPLSIGGEHSYRNTQCACGACNRAKGAKPMGQQRLFD